MVRSVECKGKTKAFLTRITFNSRPKIDNYLRVLFVPHIEILYLTGTNVSKFSTTVSSEYKIEMRHIPCNLVL